MPEWRPIRGWSVACAAAVAVLVGAGGALAQVDAAAQPSGEVEVVVDSFGAGNTARVGEIAGLKIAVTDSAERPREVLVSVSLRDGDGDNPIYQEVVTTNPASRQPVWLYPRLPFWFNSSSVITVSVNAAQEVDGGPRDPSLARHTAGRLLGQLRVPAPQRLLGSQVGMIGVVGRRVMGLSPYEGDPNRDFMPVGHERTDVAPLDLASMPDRWFGLNQFDAIAWGEGDPGRLSAESAHAVREWVRRGGHLIVVMPRVGQTWTDPATNPIHDLMPRVRVERREGVDLNEFNEVIRLAPAREVTLRPLPDGETMHVFAPEGDGGWAEGVCPILSTRDGACFVVRSLEGAGAVTLIGLDLNARFFADNTLPRPEVFWHRILGRRGMAWGQADLQAQTGGTRFSEPMREVYTLDRDFGSQIDKKEQAAAGVLIGFLVFVAYWLVAGPVGFFVLKRYGYAHHAWVGFLGAAVVFTGIAWGGATAIRPSRVQGFHLTFLDHVYGEGWQRARSWVNVLVPVYGDAGISVGDPAARAEALPAAPSERVHNVIVPWEPPGSGMSGGFPDSRTYAIRSRSPEAMRFPARSTVKQFQVEWSGGPPWEMPTPQPDGAGRAVLELQPVRTGQPAVRGVLKHGLPRELRDVVLIVVREQHVLDNRVRPGEQHNTLLSRVWIRSGKASWAPGEAWDLGAERQESIGEEERNARETLAGLLGGARFSADDSPGGSVEMGGIAMRLVAISLFGQLAPPNLNERTTFQQGEPLALRRVTHGLDLSRWFTQPCVIVIGQLEQEASPVPLFVDAGGGARATPTSGRTVVRWVYPLPPDPPDWPVREAEEGGAG